MDSIPKENVVFNYFECEVTVHLSIFLHKVTVHLCLQGTQSHSTLVVTRNIKSQYTCVYKEHKVTVHLCLQGTQSHSTLVFTRNTKSQYTCVYKEHKVTVHLCLQGT